MTDWSEIRHNLADFVKNQTSLSSKATDTKRNAPSREVHVRLELADRETTGANVDTANPENDESNDPVPFRLAPVPEDVYPCLGKANRVEVDQNRQKINKYRKRSHAHLIKPSDRDREILRQRSKTEAS